MPPTEMIATDSLLVDDRYQRDLDEPRARRIARDYEAERFGLLCVSRRGKQNFIVDGQHRWHAAKILKFPKVPCAIYEGMEAKEEANLFARMQSDRKGLSAVDRFNAQVFADYPESVAINDVVVDLGMRIDRSRHSGTTISAVISLERIYRRWGAEHLRDTLRTSNEIWGGNDGCLQGAFLDGFARFYAAYGDERFTDEVRQRLATVSPMMLMRRASAIRGGGSQMGHLIDAQLRKVARIKGRPRVKIKP